jgi:hypothetical protein
MAKRKGNETGAPKGEEKVHVLDRFQLLHHKAAMDYCRRIEAKPRGMRTAIVEEKRGTYWKDKAIIRFGKDGEVKSPPGYEPTEHEQIAIRAEFAAIVWPEQVPTRTIMNPHPHFAKTADANTFVFYDKDGYIRMVQLRFETEDSGKIYVGYTYWSDQIWRMLEPEGLLPLWGIDRYENQAEVFIHEGAKAARAISDSIKAGTIGLHPWGEDMAHALHVGWIGGAQNPGRTDWSFLKEKNIQHAYIVLDRDYPGESALRSISQAIKMPATWIKFPDSFPHGFDMADPWPQQYFEDIDGAKFYVGPVIDQISGPATWMTNVEKFWVKSKKADGKPLEKKKVVLSDNAKHDALYLPDLDRFVMVNRPFVQYSPQHFNNVVAHLSDARDVAKMYLEAENKFAARLTYDPSTTEKVIHSPDGMMLNLYRPSLIRPQEGDHRPFIEFMDHLFPLEEDRNEMLRWVATLIARPERRMLYATLLVSEQTGVGKTTLAQEIIVPLVGRTNCSFPREGALAGDFNDWCGAKRFAYIAEIYQGHDFKVTNALKSAISDGTIRVNAKYDKEYEVDNRIHIMASSNSMRAIRLDLEDRRWLIPYVTEERWGEKNFERFYKWLRIGGLPIIRHWADNFRRLGGYVKTGEHAPMTNRKMEVITEGKSQGQVLAESIGMGMRDCSRPICINDVDLHAYIVGRIKGKMYDSKLELRKSCAAGGAILHRGPGDGRFTFSRMNAYALINGAAKTLIDRGGEAEAAIIQRLYTSTVGGIRGFMDEDM